MDWLVAHAFGQAYTLPVPLWLFLYGGAAAVILSFVVVSILVDRPQARSQERVRSAGELSVVVLRLGQLAVWGLTLVSIWAGFAGAQTASGNINVTLFWIIFYLGFAYLTLLLGNTWPLLNPISSLMGLYERLRGKHLRPLMRYPAQLGSWPAVLLYVGFIWLEILSASYATTPFHLSQLIMGYVLLSLAGTLAFGTDWFRYGDLFGVFFRLFGRLSPVSYRSRQIVLRVPGTGILEESAVDSGLVFFIMFMLSSTAYDGLRETVPFASFYNWLIATVPGLSNLSPQLVKGLLLILSPLLFWMIFVAFISLMKRVAPIKADLGKLVRQFAPTLLPIAVAYNVAHYYPLLVTQGQLIIKLLSDPLGRDWNLFGTAGYRIDAGLLNAATVWYSQVILIVLGHIIAVYVAHLVALRLYPSTKQAMLSQYPMLLLMVIYTMTSLWIVAQPITIGG